MAGRRLGKWKRLHLQEIDVKRSFRTIGPGGKIVGPRHASVLAGSKAESGTAFALDQRLNVPVSRRNTDSLEKDNHSYHFQMQKDKFLQKFKKGGSEP